MTEFLHMGGYAPYIWPAYGLTLVVLGGLAVRVHLKLKKAKAEADQ